MSNDIQNHDSMQWNLPAISSWILEVVWLILVFYDVGWRIIISLKPNFFCYMEKKNQQEKLKGNIFVLKT